ncbi:MAG TPA: DUF1152 domain-containing protein [Solirubrobacterales bacterium]
MGGGGDVVGSLALARYCESLGTESVLGGVAWERFAVDPYPGPRPVEQIVGGRRLDGGAVIADAATSTPEGVRFCEAGMAGFLGTPIVLVDITGGPAGVAAGVRAAAAELGCDLAVFVDVGGDAIAHGTEPGLASPLCDAVMLAGAGLLEPELPVVGGVFGPGCDAELSPPEVLARIAVFARAGAWLGTWSMTREIAEELVAAAEVVPTEASLQAARCALGETGEARIRGGRRSVELSPLGALTFFFDPLAGPEALPLADAVAGAADLEAARGALEALGIRTELDYERDRAAELHSG